MTGDADKKPTPYPAPAMGVGDKLAALEACVAGGSYEDVCGHLCDLLLHFGAKTRPAPAGRSLRALVDRYGACPSEVRD